MPKIGAVLESSSACLVTDFPKCDFRGVAQARGADCKRWDMSKVRPVVVLIEDDVKLRRLLRNSLQQEGFDVREADCGRTGLIVAATKKPDLILLDLGLPDIDGSEVIMKIREWWSARPVIILSGRDSEAAKIAALELGADDYVTKPFGLPELLARVRAALRRASRHTHANPTTPFCSHGVSIDILHRQVTRNGAAVDITPNEFRVLAVLVKRAGMLVTTRMLLDELWGPDSSPQHRNYLRVYMASLRQKLEPNPTKPVLLLTEAGVGYRIAVDDTQSAELTDEAIFSASQSSKPGQTED